MIDSGSNIHVPKFGTLGGSPGYTITCNVPSPNFNVTSPDSLEDKYLENLAPRLEIVEQPVSKFRFRYITEMKGPHGCLAGKTAKSSHQKTYPTVRLCNYYRDDAIIRCSLYTTDRNNPLPHAHTLIATTDKPNKDREIHEIALHEKSVNSQNDYTAEFPGLGILHVPQKKLAPKLFDKLWPAYQQKFLRGPGSTMSEDQVKLSLQRIREMVQKIAEDQAKQMDKNQVSLLFEALRRDENGFYSPICGAELSEPIQNQKSPKTNELKICKVDKIEGLCTGGEEIYLLVEKVSKHDIQVHFVDKERGWRAHAEFTQADVHHQYAIVCRTPAYVDQDIVSDVRVQIELYRPSDEAVSEKGPTFTYKPNFASGKRSRTDNWNRSTTNTREAHGKKQKVSYETHYQSNGLLEATYVNIFGSPLSAKANTDFDSAYASSCARSVSLSSDNCESIFSVTDTEEGEHSLKSLLENYDPDPALFEKLPDPVLFEQSFGNSKLPDPVLFEQSFGNSKLPDPVLFEQSFGNSKLPNSDSQIVMDGGKSLPGRKPSLPDKSKQHAGSRKESFEEPSVEDIVQKIADVQIQDDAKASQECFEETKDKTKSMELVMKVKTELYEAAKEKSLLMLAARNACKELKGVLSQGVRDVNVRDENGATALHWAVRSNSPDCIRELLKCPDIDLNATDADGRTPLHTAVDKDDYESAEALIEAGADVTIPNGKTGDTVLHTAVKWYQTSLIITLLQTGKFTLEEENYDRVTVKALVEKSKDEDLRTLFTFAANTCALSDDTSEDELSTEDSDESEDGD